MEDSGRLWTGRGKTSCSNIVSCRWAGFRAIDNGLGPAPAAPAYGPGTEGAGIRVCGYALKNSGLIVVVDPPAPSCLCERTPCQDPNLRGSKGGSGWKRPVS